MNPKLKNKKRYAPNSIGDAEVHLRVGVCVRKCADTSAPNCRALRKGETTDSPEYVAVIDSVTTQRSPKTKKQQQQQLWNNAEEKT